MSNKAFIFCLGFAVLFLNTACKITKPASPNWKEIPGFASLLQMQIDTSPVFSKSFTGFALYDPGSDQMIVQSNADKYFTPASNTKIFTFYTSLKILKDSIPAIRYLIRNDSLFFWGTGDPTLLHPYISDSSAVIDFLRSRPEELFFVPNNFEDEHFGRGWAWDDYYYAYQAEKAPLPVYGNIVQLKGLGDSLFSVCPPYFKKAFQAKNTRRRVERMEHSNVFLYDPLIATDSSFQRDIPFKYSPVLVAKLLQEACGKSIKVAEVTFPDSIELNLIYSQAADTIYQRMMQVSDNFLAEQLMLLCAGELTDTLSTKKAIQYARDSLLQDLPDKPIWVDGSGLSRHNLFTPRSIVKLLHKIHQSIPEERIFAIFPSGGVSGTIEEWYGNGETPYIFAKTGTLSNKHCLSGYLKTKKGETLIFSFMHNNYITNSRPLKKEMQLILRFIYDHY